MRSFGQSGDSRRVRARAGSCDRVTFRSNHNSNSEGLTPLLGLAWQVAEGPTGKSKSYVSLSQGWALGSAEFKKALVQDHALAADSRAWESQGAREIRQQAWELLFHRALATLGRKESELANGPKSAPWKVAMATFLKERTQASNPWLAQRLGMQRPTYVSRLVSAARRAPQPMSELIKLRDKCIA